MQRALIEREKSCLLLIDVQEKLAPAEHKVKKLIRNCRWLLQVAGELNVPVLASEQYPAGLGPTVKSLRALLATDEVLSKNEFSCCAADGFLQHLASLDRNQIVVIGIEAHVCVLQTVHGLLDEGYAVFLVADAVSSRSPQDRKLAIRRMRDAGATIVSREMVVFEWLKRANTGEFKRINTEYLR